MSDLSELATEAERTAFLRLEKWLREIGRKLPLSMDEMLIGTGLIADLRIALGLPPLLGSCANAPPARKSDSEIEAQIIEWPGARR